MLYTTFYQVDVSFTDSSAKSAARKKLLTSESNMHGTQLFLAQDFSSTQDINIWVHGSQIIRKTSANSASAFVDLFCKNMKYHFRSSKTDCNTQ